MWKKALAVLLGFLILGVTVSGASARASFVNSTVNGTVTVPPGLTPEKRPGDGVQPQVAPVFLIGIEFAAGNTLLYGFLVSVASVFAVGLYHVIKEHQDTIIKYLARLQSQY